jgi:23S rRNA (adenine2503-C2)-methyltransferase
MAAPRLEPASKHALYGMPMPELEALLGSRARAVAALKWVYGERPVPSGLPDNVPGVSKRVWATVKDRCALPIPRVIERNASTDGTTKLLLGLDDVSAETVLIPGKGRSTVCISSQSGCTRSCRFCATATLGFKRNLRAEELIAQYLLARAEAPSGKPATNVVFMGMGEPLDNLDQVLRAVELLTQTPAPQLALTQVTVSTSGVLPGMKRFLKECRASLALSLNASNDEQRTRLMPHNKTWPISALLGLLREDALENPKRVHLIEYVLFDGVNDQDADADRVIALMDGLNARVNLIPHNPFSGNPLGPPTKERVLAFHDKLNRAGVRTMVRWPRGREIAAACGQLAGRDRPAETGSSAK